MNLKENYHAEELFQNKLQTELETVSELFCVDDSN